MIALLNNVTIIIITLVASCFGIISGFGISTIMMPVLLLFLPFTQAIMLTGIIHLFHDFWMIVFFGHRIDWRMFILFGFPGVLASYLGALIVGKQTELLSSLLGAFLIIYVIWLFIVPTFVIASNIWTNLVGGSLTGFLAGIFGVRGAVRSLFLSAFDLPKATYIGTTGIINILIDSTRIMTYFKEGIRLDPGLLSGLIIYIPVSFLGAQIGTYLLRKIPQDYFRKVIAFFLFLIGIKLLLAPLF